MIGRLSSQNFSNAYPLTESTVFSGDVSGTYDNIVIADDSHNHITSNIDGLEEYIEDIIAGALTAGSQITVTYDDNANTITIAHADTSTQASVNNSNGTVIQDVTVDGNGHVTALGSVDLDGRYYTETEADARFLRGDTSDTLSGTLTVTGGLTVDTNTLHVDATNNRVGIGTTSPASSLEVHTDFPKITLTNDDQLVSANAYFAGIEMRDSSENLAGAVGFISGEDQDMRITSYRAGASLHLVTGGANNNRITITDTGNVGIGTTSPTVPLDVVGDVNIATASGDGYLQVLHQAIDTALYVNLTASGQMDAQEVSLFAQNPNTEISVPLRLTGSTVHVVGDLNVDEDTLFVDASTNSVGIGTASPAEVLDVVGNISVSGNVSGGSTSFPTSLDSNQLAAVEALQAKVGVDGSAVTTSLDYKLAQLTADAVVSDQINEIVQLTQAAYDALTPDANTLYVIVG